METIKTIIIFLGAYPIWAKLLATGGLGVTILTLIFAPRSEVSNGILDNFRITVPGRGEAVAWKFVVEGEYSTVPDNFEVWIMTTDSASNRYWPQERAILGADRKWRSRVTGIGGNPGDRRTFGAFLVGPNGRALLELWKRAAPHKKGLELTRLTTDIQKIQELVVVVKSGRPVE